jgi:hypothetical protein
MALTGSNIAHRLRGKKRMDDAEANRFTERQGLPIGWLDTPRSEPRDPGISVVLAFSRFAAEVLRARTTVEHACRQLALLQRLSRVRKKRT